MSSGPSAHVPYHLSAISQLARPTIMNPVVFGHPDPVLVMESDDDTTLEHIEVSTPLVLRKKSRYARDAFSEGPCVPISPSDSGYGSKPASPEYNSSPRSSCEDWGCNGVSDSNSSVATVEEDTVVDQDRETDVDPRAKSATLPRLKQVTRLGVPAAFISNGLRIPARRYSDGGPSSLRLPDRFVPFRDNSTSFTEKYRSTKNPRELTGVEKLLRHHSATPDAFCYRPRRVTPTGRVDSRSDVGPAPRTRAITALGTRDMNVRGNAIVARVPSHGSVWSVGGVAPSGGTVDNGRGGLYMSGTHAPLFTSNFALARAESEAEEKHKGRLAAALNIDLVSRVLNYKVSEDKPTHGSKKLVKSSMVQRKTYWNGAGWSKDGGGPSTCIPTEVFHTKSACLSIHSNLSAETLQIPRRLRVFESFQQLPSGNSAPSHVLCRGRIQITDRSRQGS